MAKRCKNGQKKDRFGAKIDRSKINAAPGLVKASTSQRAAYTLLGGGAAVAWDEINEDVCVELMLRPAT